MGLGIAGEETDAVWSLEVWMRFSFVVFFKKKGDGLRYDQGLICKGKLVLESNFLVMIILQYTQRLCGSQAASIREVVAGKEVICHFGKWESLVSGKAT